jgi:ribosomal protein L7Ae-like RNA K-turn-binding protein
MARAKRMKTEKIRGLLGLGRRARTVVVGSRETRASLRRGEIRLVLLASDGSARDRERVLRVSEEEHVPALDLATRAELGSWIGREAVCVLGIQDPHLAGALRACLGEAAGESAAPRRENAGEKR